ncbi:MAG: MBL fold metallo-hydrolase [Chloroflexi bacterium]|nr:MBL fold metallo-hydrolase [Chloroflexota bacterium]
MNITFRGAARSVTGSRHVLEIDGRRILLDCGLVQGKESHGGETNEQLGFDATGIETVILSHAHIDHSGALPSLIHNGFGGRIYATPATADLAEVMLRDSAKIQEQDAADANRHEGLVGAQMRRPLYTLADAQETASRFLAKPYREPFEVADGVTVTFFDAGHILGSAMVQVDVRRNGQAHRLVFSGDIGHASLPIVRKRDVIEQADTLLMESTYGNTEHGEVKRLEGNFAALINRVAAQNGKILIPAFAVGRTQQITYMLNNLYNAGKVADIPVFVDSPLASETTDVFRRHPECWDPAMVQALREAHDADPFGFKMLRYVHTVEQSKLLNEYNGPAIIIAASGMCENGRIVHHLAHHMGDRRNVVMIVGYQAEGTLGRRLLEGEHEFFIAGQRVERKALVVKMMELSAHAGRSQLQGYFQQFKGSVRNLFLVHGEPSQSMPFAQWAQGVSKAKVAVPSLGETFELGG